MPNPIGILRPGQTGLPSRHIRKDVAESLAARKIIFWIVPGKLAAMSDLSQFAESMKECVQRNEPLRVYLPERIPSLEVGGCWFDHPASRPWRREHRVVFQPPPKKEGSDELREFAAQLEGWAASHTTTVAAQP